MHRQTDRQSRYLHTPVHFSPAPHLSLSPLYSSPCRVIASLNRVMSKEDVATPVLEALKREFYGMMKTKNQQYIDNKVRNVRYLAELVKFGVAPPITAFRMFKTMMADFSPHNIELVAILLESCGRCVSSSFLISPRYLFEHLLN